MKNNFCKQVLTQLALHLHYLPLLVLGLTIAPALAHGHAVVISSVPADNSVSKTSPPSINLRFNSRIENRLTRVKLLTKEGKVIPLPPVKSSDKPGDHLSIPIPPLGAGSYILQYRVLATDGHATPGLLRFTISGAENK